MSDGTIFSDYWGAKFNVTKWRRYHSERVAHYERLDRWVAFLSIFLGSAAIANLAGWFNHLSGYQFVLAGLIAVMNAAKLVFEFSRNAQIHRDMHREMTALCIEIYKNNTPSDDNIRSWEASMIDINARMYKIFWAAEAHAYNQTVVEFYENFAPPIKISGYKFKFRNLLTFSNDNFVADWSLADKHLRPTYPAPETSTADAPPRKAG
ncbi:hypothetical protein [Phreatobacter sp.]|uniref:hypothetical protein n=1 Tax=Phreatobacter sp. TaxID=1966341 RepID=UPI0022BE0A91|nr:hypothetical protein [Phreatobacter sp.]MCZ8315105.1 hypothetical protein [Phreatobacter sp.]